MTRIIRDVAAMVALGLLAHAEPVVAQNDWQFPDPYFGAFQHRSAGTPQAERRYRAEIAPQQPPRLSDLHAAPGAVPPRRWLRHRGRWSPAPRPAGRGSTPPPVSRPADRPPPAQPPPARPSPGP